MPTTSVSGATLSSSARELGTAHDSIRISLCDTMWSSEKRRSITGLKICTFWRAIWARRRRRISSSLLPLNMLPVMTSIHPCAGNRCGTSMSLPGSGTRLILAGLGAHANPVADIDEGRNLYDEPRFRAGRLDLRARRRPFDARRGIFNPQIDGDRQIDADGFAAVELHLDERIGKDVVHC